MEAVMRSGILCACESSATARRSSNGQFENVAFADAQRRVEAFGFELDRVRGSHYF
jgi:hypothetical protein